MSRASGDNLVQKIVRYPFSWTKADKIGGPLYWLQELLDVTFNKFNDGVFEFCWSISNALCRGLYERLAEYQKELKRQLGSIHTQFWMQGPNHRDKLNFMEILLHLCLLV